MSNKKLIMITMVTALLGIGQLFAADPKQTTATVTQPAEQGKTPKIRCDNPKYEFPEVWGGEKVKHAFTIHNDGDATLEILKVRSGCGCTTVKGYDKKIPPGGKTDITFEVKTSTRAPKKTVSPTITSNDPVTPTLRLTITGKVKIPITLNPLSGANWGMVLKDQDLESKTVKLTNNTDNPMKLKLIEPKHTTIYTWELKETVPGKEAEITITPHKPYKEGSNKLYLYCETGIAKLDKIYIPCNLHVKPMVEVMPSMGMHIRLSNSPDRPTSTGRVNIKYNGEGKMQIKSAVSSDPAINVDIATMKEGLSYYITATVPNDYKVDHKKRPHITVTTDVQPKPTVVRVRITPSRTPPKKTQNKPEDLIGKSSPRIIIKKGDNKKIYLGPINNKITVLNFWATYCAACRRQLPIVQKIFNDYRSKGIEFLDICTDPKKRTGKEIQEIAKKIGADFPVALDTTMTASTRYHVRSLPTLFLLGKKGTVEAVHKGAGKTSNQLEAFEKTIRTELDLLLAGKTRKDFPKKPDSPKPTEAAAANEPQLVILNSTQQHTGRHKPGETVKYEIRYRNNGKKPLQLTAVKPLTENLKVEQDATNQLQYGAIGILKCEFKVPTQSGEFTNQLTIESNDPKHPKMSVTLKSLARPYLEIAPATGVDFSRKTNTHSMPRLATVVYNGPGTIEYKGAESSSPKFEATVTPIGNGPYAKVIVTAKPPFDLGVNKAVIRIKTTCKAQPVVEIPVTLYMPSDIEITPPKVELRKSRQLQRSTVSIVNNSQESLSILSLTKSDPNIQWQFYPEPDGRSYKLVLTIPGNFENGSEPTKVTIRTDNEKFGEIVIPITVN
ncbi:MAG: DUF1573 domain-containing protein [Planctomycetota bacterium]